MRRASVGAGRNRKVAGEPRAGHVAFHRMQVAQLKPVIDAALVALLMMIFIAPQSFMPAKLPLLAIVLLSLLMGGLRNAWYIRSKAFLFYYLIFALLALTWCVVGLLRGNPTMAIVEAVRLYFVYMLVHGAIVVYISNHAYQDHVDKVIAAAAFGIGIVAIYALADHVLHLGWLPESVKETMYLQVGVHSGYVQMNNINIGMLTFIVPYLLCRNLMIPGRSGLLLLALGTAILAALLASRRIVLLLIFLVPLIALGLTALSGQLKRAGLRRFLGFYGWTLVLAMAATPLLMYLDAGALSGFADRVLGVFSADPDAPRPMQHAALLEGFSRHYVWGSGFGGETPVVRSEERPWTYELTYSRLLFNSGLLGVGLLAIFFASYVFLVFRKIGTSRHAPVYIALMTGFVSMSLAAASNPYLSSFDFLFSLSIIPLILNSTDFTRGSSAVRGDVA